MGEFGYSSEVLARFPTTRGAVLAVEGIDNRESSSDLRDLYFAEQELVVEQIGETALSEIESVAAWRRTFTAFGVKPTQYRSAVEALLRRLTKSGDIPSINTMVDIANLISIRHRLPAAVFDQAEVTGSTTVRFAAGDESFTDLGGQGDTNPEPGEVVFVDDALTISARRWCWRQSAQSAARPATTKALVTIESQHDDTGEQVRHAADDFASLLRRFQPDATHEIYLLGPARPATYVERA